MVLEGLPSRPGPHIQQIKVLGDLIYQSFWKNAPADPWAYRLQKAQDAK